FPRARDTLLASSRATRRSGRFARFRPNVRPPARTTCSTQSRIPSYASCPWRRNDPLSDTETPATTDSCEVTPVPFSAHSGVGSDSCFAGSELSCALRNIEDTGDGERSEALSTIALAMRMQELVAQYAEGVRLPLGRRSTIVGVPPSEVANFAKSLIVGARRGFSDAARRSIESAWPRVESGPAGPHRPTTRRGSAIGPAGPGRRRRRGPIAGHRRRGHVGPSHR